MENINNKRDVYHLHCELDKEYEPLQKRGRRTYISSSDLQSLRLQGKKNIDLWTDGTLYPIDPMLGSAPAFFNITSLLRFAADGYAGLLGYTMHITAASDILRLERQFLQQENDALKKNLQEMSELQKCLEEKSKIIKNLENRLARVKRRRTLLGERMREKSLRNIESLKLGSGGCIRRIQAAR